MNKPTLLVFDELMEPIKRSKNGIEEIENELRKDPSTIVLRSLYGYLFAVFETTLNDLLTYILRKIPKKMSVAEKHHSCIRNSATTTASIAKRPKRPCISLESPVSTLRWTGYLLQDKSGESCK